MGYKIIPLTTEPNQILSVTIPVNDKNITLNLVIRYNVMANYWVMTIKDSFGNILIGSIPLTPGEYPAADILGQYQYLAIGSAFVVNASNTDIDIPTDTTLGTDHFLLWGDGT